MLRKLFGTNMNFTHFADYSKWHHDHRLPLICLPSPSSIFCWKSASTSFEVSPPWCPNRVISHQLKSISWHYSQFALFYDLNTSSVLETVYLIYKFKSYACLWDSRASGPPLTQYPSYILAMILALSLLNVGCMMYDLFRTWKQKLPLMTLLIQ